MELSKIFSVMHAWLPLIIQGTVMTVAVSCLALVIGMAFGVVLGIGSCNKFKHAVCGPIISFYVVIMRGTPLYVQVLIVYYVLPEILGINISAFGAGVLALGCNSIAYVTEIFRCGINTVPSGQWEAAYVLGYSSIKTLSLIILPQAFKNILPALMNEISSLIKESSILSAIGLLEITRVAINMSAKTLDPMGVYLCVALIYLFLTTMILFIAKKCEKKLGVSYDYY